MDPTNPNDQFGPGNRLGNRNSNIPREQNARLTNEIKIMSEAIIRKSKLMLGESSTATNILGRQVKKKLSEAMEILREFN